MIMYCTDISCSEPHYVIDDCSRHKYFRKITGKTRKLRTQETYCTSCYSGLFTPKKAIKLFEALIKLKVLK